MSGRVRTDLALVRQVLDVLDVSSGYQAARQFGLEASTVYRWAARRATIGPSWPTAEDIAAWQADEEANGEARRTNAARCYTYRNRAYLNRGLLQRPALGSARRLQALYALGWTQHDLGARLGVTAARVGHLMSGKFESVYPSTATAVGALYDELCMSVPVDEGPKGRGYVLVHKRARNVAKKRGYAPPLAWDNIDDPVEKPKGQPGARACRAAGELDPVIVESILEGDPAHAQHATRAERREVVARWPGTANALNRLTGWKPERYREHQVAS